MPPRETRGLRSQTKSGRHDSKHSTVNWLGGEPPQIRQRQKTQASTPDDLQHPKKERDGKKGFNPTARKIIQLRRKNWKPNGNQRRHEKGTSRTTTNQQLHIETKRLKPSYQRGQQPSWVSDVDAGVGVTVEPTLMPTLTITHTAMKYRHYVTLLV